MGIMGRTLRKAIRTLLSRKPPNTPHSIPCIHHFEDSTLTLPSCFIQKHIPYFLHQRQLAQESCSPAQSQLHSLFLLGYRLRNDVTPDHFIQGPLHLPLENVHATPNLKCPLSTEDAARIQRCVNLETAKRKLRGISAACISYKQLLDLCTNCAQNACEDEGRYIINSLEQSGDIIITGQRVYLHPQQVARAVEDILLLTAEESNRINEFKNLEKEKIAIDMESEKQARHEIYCGLGFFILQTAVLFWLTYWELSWDVMEPVSFCIACFYLCVRYVFSIVTKTDLTFESFHTVRLKRKQRKLMKIRNFDAARYAELLKICRPPLKVGNSNKLI